MSLKTGAVEISRLFTAARVLLVIISLALLSACSYHPPAPIEEHSDTMVKRQLNADGTYYVRSGDTLYAIAFGYGVDPRNVAKWNGISSPYVIYPGQKLRLSAPPAGSRSSGSSSGVQISTVKTPGRATTKTVSSPETSSQAKSAQTKSSQAKAAPVKSSPTPTASSTTAAKPSTVQSADPKSWKWPTRGRLHRTFEAGDPARNGIDIVGKEGQAITASSGGQVVYSGNGLIGYGELIIIKHSEKMLSAYAHNKVRLVKEGDQVSSGQKIAEMGRNPSNEQLLHFEIRVRGKPVNPLTYLPKK